MKEKLNHMLRDKLFLVMLVLGLLTIVAAAGVVSIQKKNRQNMENQLAEESVPDTLDQLAGNSNAKESGKAEEQEETKQDPAVKSQNQEKQYADAGNDLEKTQDRAEKGDSGFSAHSEGKENTLGEAAASAGKGAASAIVLNFNDESRITWPLYGNVLLDYSMDSTIYFPTLDQYKCNPGIVVQGDVSQPVAAPADSRVLEVGINEEIGNYVVLDLGNEYALTCGQLKEVQVVKNEYLQQGQILGYVAEPTKYYSIEGSNIFLEMKHQDETVDPLNYLQ